MNDYSWTIPTQVMALYFFFIIACVIAIVTFLYVLKPLQFAMKWHYSLMGKIMDIQVKDVIYKITK
jgi:hypothetical protein